MSANKHIALVYLGEFFLDARLTNMALSLLKEKYRVTIISTDCQIMHKDLFNTIIFHRIELEKTGILKYWEFHKKVKNALKQKQYYAIIASDLYSLAAVTSYKKNTKKIIYDCREIYFELAAHIKKPIHRYWNYCFEKYHLNAVQHIIVTAESDLYLLQQYYQQKKHLNWHIIYNYPMLLQTTTSNKQSLKKFKTKISKKNINIVYQGVIQKGRGIKQLIDLAIYNKNINGIIIGAGDHYKQYYNYNKQYNNNNNVCFLGAVPYIDLLHLTKECDIGWAVIKKRGISNQLALPNKIFEYIMAGLPIITSNLKNIKPIIEKYQIGEIITNQTIQECDAIIQQIYKNKTQYRINLKVAATQFNWNIQHQNFMEIIQ